MKLYDTLLSTLRTENAYIDDKGGLKKWVVIGEGQDSSERLLALLLGNDYLKKEFFKEVAGTLVFQQAKFLDFAEQKMYLSDSYTKYKNKVGLTSGGRYFSQRNEVELVWPYKDCVLEGGQTREEQKRDEIFFNRTLAPDEINQLTEPKVLTDAVMYDADGGHKLDGFKRDAEINKSRGLAEDTITDNLVIKGNNLLALHCLEKEFAGKVKLIYIDPPFNTQNDSFNYNDTFSRSSWLTFMRNRLLVARNLLPEDGNIFIHIDINQNHYLKLLCDEVFNEENFVEEIIWAYGSPSGGRAATPKPVNVHDYILHYAKHYSKRKQNRVYIPYSEKYINDWFKYEDENGRRYRKRQTGSDSEGNPIWSKQYLDESKEFPFRPYGLISNKYMQIRWHIRKIQKEALR